MLRAWHGPVRSLFFQGVWCAVYLTRNESGNSDTLEVRKWVRMIQPSNQTPSAQDLARHPEYTRIPAVGERCAITGLSRSSILKLIYATPDNGHKPPVRSIALKKKGAFRGTRLISVESLIAFIESHGASGKEAA